MREAAQAGLVVSELAAVAGCAESTLRIACELDLGRPLREVSDQARTCGNGDVLIALRSGVQKGDVKAIQIWLDRLVGPVVKRTRHAHEGDVNLNLDVQALANVSVRTPTLVVLPVGLMNLGDVYVVADEQTGQFRVSTTAERDALIRSQFAQAQIPANGLERPNPD